MSPRWRAPSPVACSLLLLLRLGIDPRRRRLRRNARPRIALRASRRRLDWDHPALRIHLAQHWLRFDARAAVRRRTQSCRPVAPRSRSGCRTSCHPGATGFGRRLLRPWAAGAVPLRRRLHWRGRALRGAPRKVGFSRPTRRRRLRVHFLPRAPHRLLAAEARGIQVALVSSFTRESVDVTAACAAQAMSTLEFMAKPVTGSWHDRCNSVRDETATVVDGFFLSISCSRFRVFLCFLFPIDSKNND